MLRFNFDRIYKIRGIERPFSYLVSRGFSASYATRMNNRNLRSINFNQLERLCELFQCTPNDLMEWKPGKDVTDPSSHALKDLIRTDHVSRINSLLGKIPVSDLDEIENYIKTKAGK